jgi:hypothetical protein
VPTRAALSGAARARETEERCRPLDHELGLVQLLEVAVGVFVGAELLLLVAELVLGRT